MRIACVVVGMMVVAPGLIGAATKVDAVSLTLTDATSTQTVATGAPADLLVSCTAFKTCNGEGCTPVPAYLLSLWSKTEDVAMNITLAPPASAGTTLMASDTLFDHAHARVTLTAKGAGWTVSGGYVRVDVNELEAIADHLEVTLMAVTTSDGKKVEGTITCWNADQVSASGNGGGCGGGGGGGHHDLD